MRPRMDGNGLSCRLPGPGPLEWPVRHKEKRPSMIERMKEIRRRRKRKDTAKKAKKKAAIAAAKKPAAAKR
jgi:hypothetical protein